MLVKVLQCDSSCGIPKSHLSVQPRPRTLVCGVTEVRRQETTRGQILCQHGVFGLLENIYTVFFQPWKRLDFDLSSGARSNPHSHCVQHRGVETPTSQAVDPVDEVPGYVARHAGTGLFKTAPPVFSLVTFGLPWHPFKATPKQVPSKRNTAS